MSKALRFALLPLFSLSLNLLVPTPSLAQHTDTERQKRRELHRQEYLHLHSDAKGTPRPDLLRKAIEQIKKMPVAAGVPVDWGGFHPGEKLPTGGALAAPAPRTVSPLTGVQWTQIGPAPLIIDNEENFQGSGQDSGQVVDIAVDPRNTTDQVIYIATNDGGVWKSSDGGNTWAPKTDYMPSLGMGAVALDPSNPSVVYAGTGGNFNNEGSFGQVGVFKSIDAGQTWQQLLNSFLFLQNLNIIRMVVPSSNILLVATTSGLFRSADGGLDFGNNGQLTNNGSPALN